jgi:3-oxoacyl-[acyl-carrier-protein] synthase-3
MSIEAFAYAVPPIVQTAHDIAARTGGPAEFIAEKVGLRERHVLAPGQTGVDLSTEACEALLARHPDLRASVDLVVCVTQTPDRRIPHNSAGIVERLGLPATTASFDISLGCSGYVYAVNIVEGFLERCGMTNALLVTCDPYSRIIAPEDKETNSVFGDAAAASWIRVGAGRSETLATVFGTDGSQGDAIEVPGGGARRPSVSILGGEGVEPLTRDDLRLYMRGRAVFNFVMTRVPESIDACLAKAGLTIDDIDHFALHQGSIYMLDALARRAGIPGSKVLKNMDRFGNTVSSTIPMLLADLDEEGRLAGSTVLLSGFGVGLSWATAVLRFAR